MAYHTLKTGMLAYFDSFAGLVPCRVTAITGDSGFASTRQTVTFVLTANRGAYRKGEQLVNSGLHVLPRKAARGARITAYRVEASN